MVQFKKSPVEPRQPELRDSIHPEAEIWLMPVTGEAFTSYDEYLRKLDYYKQKLFTCEITGHGRLTYFDAAQSERSGTVAMESAFPTALREPVLRKVQFEQIARLDDLVNFLYENFKDDFYPKEHVQVVANATGERLFGVIIQKTSIPAVNGKPALTRYFVELSNGDTALTESENVYRDRRSFTKQVLRSFLRYTIERDSYDGAPWLVKERFAKQYNIDNVLPRHLTQEAITAYRKAVSSLQKSKIDLDRVIPQRVDNFEEMALTILEHKGKMPQDLVIHYISAYQAVKDPLLIPSKPVSTSVPLRPSTKDHRSSHTDRKSAIPQEPKYPREDLEVKSTGKHLVRPDLAFLQDDQTELDPVDNIQDRKSLTNDSVGKALSIWTILNIHSRYYVLDSFTFDDFIDGMLYGSAEGMCELFTEVHCAVLKHLVNASGEVEASIPALNDFDSSDESSEDSQNSSREKSESAKGSRANSATPHLNGSTDHDSHANGQPLHNASVILEGFDWTLRIKDRAFENGGWQMIMIGLLYHLSLADWIDDTPARVLAALCPLDEPATKETARRNYAELDVNLRLAALECAVMLASTSKPFKESMDERSIKQTIDRKDKVDAQRRRKPLIEELQALDLQRKLKRPEDPETAPLNGEADTSIAAPSESGTIAAEDTESDVETMRGRRRSGRASDMKRKHEQIAREKSAKQSAVKAKADTAERAAYDMILADIESKRAEIKACEEDISLVDGKLRENSCHRTKCLGTDRFCNRYWWFERNGMPFGGQNDSSTAANGYANGRLWVQGPTLLDRQGFFEISESEAAKFKSLSGFTPATRRSAHEGSTILETASDWGYYSTVAQLDGLIAWVDERGHRERALLKELYKWRLQMKDTMEARAAYIEGLVERRRHLVDEAGTGIATRKKALAEGNRIKHPCLAWTNGEALRTLGRLHCESATGKRGVAMAVRGVGRPKQSGFTAANHVLPGKRETRRGTKY